MDLRTGRGHEEAGACRTYHFALGVFLIALCGIPVALAAVTLSILFQNAAVIVAASVALWVVLGWLAVRWAYDGYVEVLLEASPSAGAEECVEGLREELPLYVAFVSVLALALAAGRAFWFDLGGIAFVLCLSFLGTAALYSLLGFVERVRESVYPKYPGLVGVALFAPGMVFLVAFYLTGV